MKTYSDREVIKRLREDGWAEVKGGGKGSHRKFKKSSGKITIVPRGDLPPATYKSIAKMAGWE